MSKFGSIASLEKEVKVSPFRISKEEIYEASIQQKEALQDVLQCTNISGLFDMVKMEMSAINLLEKNNDYRGIIDIISRGNLDDFHKRLGISSQDLFQRTPSGIRDVYVSSLTEDVTNFISNLWDAVKNAIQKVYDWSGKLYSDGSKISMCKSQFDSVLAALQSKGGVGVTIDMTDPGDTLEKMAEILRLYQILHELLASAAQSIVAGQITEKSLQDQLLGKMQRASVINIKLNIEEGTKSSSFVFPGIASGRIELKNAAETVTQIKNQFDAVLAQIESLNKAVAAYAQNITTAQTQYKCNTDCASVVGNISSATQFITKSIVSVNSYVSEILSNGILDILGKISSTIGSMPEAPAPQEPPQPPQQITPMPTQQEQQPAQPAQAESNQPPAQTPQQ